MISNMGREKKYGMTKVDMKVSTQMEKKMGKESQYSWIMRDMKGIL